MIDDGVSSSSVHSVAETFTIINDFLFIFVFFAYAPVVCLSNATNNTITIGSFCDDDLFDLLSIGSASGIALLARLL